MNPCSDHDPNSGPGSDWCPNCRLHPQPIGDTIRQAVETLKSEGVPGPYHAIVPPDSSRVPINIDPAIRQALQAHLQEAYAGTGVGYSEWIRRALTWDQAKRVPDKVQPDTRWSSADTAPNPIVDAVEGPTDGVSGKPKVEPVVNQHARTCGRRLTYPGAECHNDACNCICHVGEK